MSWLKNALLQSNKPKQSVIGVLKLNLGGSQKGRNRDTLHASDISTPNFCPRKWAFDDMKEVSHEAEFLSTALAVTFRIGTATEKLMVEDWLGDAVIGNWRCLRCHDQRSMCAKPEGSCTFGGKHIWEYVQVRIESPEYNVSGGIDVILNVGAPRWMITEIKMLNPTEFDEIKVPFPEHRLRTNLYMKLIEASNHAYKDKFILTHARVVYVSRAHGKMNAEWGEILPFKEYEVKRDDASLTHMLQKAKALKIFREGGAIPSGICGTAFDKIAQKCSRCKDCFGGEFKAPVKFESLQV